MIFRWTVKKLWRSRLGVATSTAAIAVAFLVVTLFEAVWTGESEQLVAYFRNTDADVWVMQDGVVNMHMATSFIPDTQRDLVREVEGVERADSILYLNTLVRAGGKNWFSYVVGIEQDTEIGGPWATAAGKRVPADGEAVIPAVLSQLTGVAIGDEIGISDRTFTVVGLSEGTFSVGNPITFVTTADLASTISLTGYDSYLLVKAAPGVDHDALAARIEKEIDDVEVLTSATFIANDLQLAKQMGVELVQMMTAISAVLSVLVVAFVLYVHTASSRRELAVLKALGFRNRHVYVGVVTQALAITGLGFALALLAALTIAALAPTLLPQLSVVLTAETVIKVGLIGLTVATVASLIPARQVVSVDPLSAFHN